MEPQRDADGSSAPGEGGEEPLLRLRDAGLAARGFGDETVVLDLRSSMYLSTNPAGSVLWRELERGTTRPRLVDALLNEFDVDVARAAADVDAFIDECRRRDLLDDR